MKHLPIYIALLLLAGACKKETKTRKAPAFDVTADKKSYVTGEPVNFTFTGNPDQITFFSGETGKKYEYLDRTQADGTPYLKFTSARANGSQPGSLQLLASSDFAGKGNDTAATLQNIAKATWVDITSKATLSSGSSTSSGNIDLSDLAEGGKPVFLAFKYTAQAGSVQNKWTITGLTLNNVLPDQTTYLLANLSSGLITNYGVQALTSPGWVSYLVTGGSKWVVTSGSSLVITGATTAGAATAPIEAWTFSGPIDLKHVTHDAGTPVKEITARLGSYSYTYSKTGVYKVTFIAANNDIYGTREVVKEMEVTVTQ